MSIRTLLPSTILLEAVIVAGISVIAQDGPPTQKPVTPIDKLGGDSRDLNAGLKISKRPAAEKQVLIYYTNEPNVAAFRKLQTLIRTQKGAIYDRTASRIDDDLKNFHAAVATEVELIRTQAPVEIGVAIFTNELARKHQCLIKANGDREFETTTFPFLEVNSASEGSKEPAEWTADVVLHPLSAAGTLDAALNLASQHFAPTNHEFVLVTKSHGNKELAMATMMGQVLYVSNEKELIKCFASLANERGFDVAADGTLKAHIKRETASTVLQNGAEAKTLSPETNNTLSPDMNDTLGGKILVTGMTKRDFYSVLNRHAKQCEFYIPVLFAESCRSEVDRAALTNKDIEPFTSPAIGTIYASNATGLRYTTADYRKICATMQHGTNLSTAFQQHLDEVQKSQMPIGK